MEPSWLVVPGWVEDEVAQEFAGGLDDDADVPVLDEQEDVGSGVGSSDADVVEAASWIDWWRRVTTPESSMRSRRTRSWLGAVPVGVAFGRAA